MQVHIESYPCEGCDRKPIFTKIPSVFPGHSRTDHILPAVTVTLTYSLHSVIRSRALALEGIPRTYFLFKNSTFLEPVNYTGIHTLMQYGSHPYIQNETAQCEIGQPSIQTFNHNSDQLMRFKCSISLNVFFYFLFFYFTIIASGNAVQINNPSMYT